MWIAVDKVCGLISQKAETKMDRTLPTLALGCTLICFNAAAAVVSEADAVAAISREDFAAASSAYKQLVDADPTSVALRLEFANALKNDRQWERAISEYRKVLKLHPKNAEALLGIGSVRRCQGNIAAAKRTYEQVVALAPHESSGMQGLAATYALDHDFANAEKLYEQAERMWPGDSGVQQAAYDFRRQRNPRIYLFWETDLSFETRQGGAIMPFAGREEIGAEYQEENSFFVPRLGNSRLWIYKRKDEKIFYTHYFGIDNMFDASARHSVYQYQVPDSALGFTSIDTYQEYRARYTVPLVQGQVFSVRYTLRPTILKLSQGTFTAHKVEVELNSRWTPTFSTLLKGGWLRDLDSNATSTSQLTDRSLVNVGFQWDATNHLSLGAKHITNPDLDNTMNSTSIAEASYTLTGTWSLLGRYRVDDYKSGTNQRGYYLAARFVPNSNWWSEFGLKHVDRGDANGYYGLASISYRF